MVKISKEDKEMLREVKRKLAQMPIKDRIILLKAKKNVDNLIKKTREELSDGRTQTD